MSGRSQIAATGPPGALARPDWRIGGEFTAGDLRLDQDYRLQRLRRHLRLMHGWGVVCGLNVVAAPANDANGGWNLLVCPGYGIGPCGDEILVQKQFSFNLREYLWTRPIRSDGGRVWIAIEADGEPDGQEHGPEPASATACDCGCGCESSAKSVSSLSDGFNVVVLWSALQLTQRGFDICSGTTPSCPACPEICALPLASVVLPSAGEPILSSAITNLGD